MGPAIKGLIAYNRWDGHGSATVIVNTTPEPLTARVKTRFNERATLVDLLSGERFRAERSSGELAVHMPARSARILVEERHDYEAFPGVSPMPGEAVVSPISIAPPTPRGGLALHVKKGL